MLKGFKDFILRGNVVDLAVAVVLGVAFGAVVTSVVENLITPLIASIAGVPDVSGAFNFTIGKGEFHIGLILQAIINFLLIAAAVYFVIVVPINKLSASRKQGEEEAPEAPSEEVLLLTQIRDLLGGADTTVVGPPTGGTGPTAPGSAPPAAPVDR